MLICDTLFSDTLNSAIKPINTMNPFVYGRVVHGKEFAGRKNLIKELSQFFLNSQHTLILWSSPDWQIKFNS